MRSSEWYVALRCVTLFKWPQVGRRATDWTASTNRHTYAVRLKWFSSIVEYTCPSLVR